MLFNLVIGFILPWVLAIFFLPNKEIIIFIVPVSSAIAFTINTLGFYFFWDLRPVLSREQSLSRLPVDLGLYPVSGCFLIHFITALETKPSILIILFSSFLTALELIAKKFNKVIYRNRWNGYLTFLSYFTGYALTYCYYLIVQFKVFNKYCFFL